VVTVKRRPLLATPPTVTTTFPVVAPLGTGATMVVLSQLVGVVAVPLNVTVLVPSGPPKFDPVMITEVPFGPNVGFKPEMFGRGGVTVNKTPLLLPPLVLITMFPVVAPGGTKTVMLVALQVVAVALAPLNVTKLVPWVAPKFVPAIVTTSFTAPEVGFTVVILGGG
jgi:hypothetical protein